MKKLILLLALAFVMCGCETSMSETNKEKIQSYDGFKTINPEIVIIDSCEYIVCYSIGGTQNLVWREPVYIHKGSCKFCAERRKKEQEELIRKIKEQ